MILAVLMYLYAIFENMFIESHTLDIVVYLVLV